MGKEDNVTSEVLPNIEIIDGPEMRFDVTKTYYLAGPMTGYPKYNFDEFEYYTKLLRAAGVRVESPHEIDHGETEETRGKLPYEVYLNAGIRLLDSCGGIILLSGWPQSGGTCAELSRSIDLGFPVYFIYQPNEWTENVRLICMNRRPPA